MRKRKKERRGTEWLEIGEQYGQLNERNSLHINNNVYTVTIAYCSVSMKTVTGPYYFRH